MQEGGDGAVSGKRRQKRRATVQHNTPRRTQPYLVVHQYEGTKYPDIQPLPKIAKLLTVQRAVSSCPWPPHGCDSIMGQELCGWAIRPTPAAFLGPITGTEHEHFQPSKKNTLALISGKHQRKDNDATSKSHSSTLNKHRQHKPEGSRRLDTRSRRITRQSLRPQERLLLHLGRLLGALGPVGHGSGLSLHVGSLLRGCCRHLLSLLHLCVISCNFRPRVNFFSVLEKSVEKDLKKNTRKGAVGETYQLPIDATKSSVCLPPRGIFSCRGSVVCYIQNAPDASPHLNTHEKKQ